LSAWIKTLSGNLVYTHLHNNHGDTDVHLAFGDGVIDFPEILDTLRALPQPPLFSLELPTLESINASLPYLQLTA
jgi:sugar phosphate isomerase/epimerase